MYIFSIIHYGFPSISFPLYANAKGKDGRKTYNVCVGTSEPVRSPLFSTLQYVHYPLFSQFWVFRIDEERADPLESRRDPEVAHTEE